MDLSVTIGRVYFSSLLSNAAGTVKTIEQVRKVARSASGCVRVGSYMFDERPGNSGRVFWEPEDLFCSFNALGIPGPGYLALVKMVPQMADIAHANGKPLVVSPAGTSPEEYGRMATLLDYGADILEVNAGCPNLYFEGTQKPILSYHPASLKKSLQEICETVGESRMERVGVKVSPYFYDSDFFKAYGIELRLPPPGPEIFYESVEVIKESGISHVIAINTVPNAWMLADDGKPAINSPEVSSGCGGLAGPLIKQLAIAEGNRWREALPPEIAFVAVGGIESGADVKRCLDYAVAAQIGTAFYRDEDPRIFERVMGEYIDILAQEKEF